MLAQHVLVVLVAVHLDVELLGQRVRPLHRIRGHRHDRAELGQHRDILQGAAEPNGRLAGLELAIQVAARHHRALDALLVTLVDQIGEDVHPLALGQPCIHEADVERRVLRRRDRRDHELAAEEVLVLDQVAFLVVRVAVVQRLDQRHVLVVRPDVGTVEVGHQPVAQAQVGVHVFAHVAAVLPRLLAREGVLGAVQAVDGAEYAQLQPAQRECRVEAAPDVPADVVAPPRVADVRGGRGEVRLEVQRRPGDDRVA